MKGEQIAKLAMKVMSNPIAGRSTDPRFYQGLNTLPDPDPILRSMGRDGEVYDAIMSDAHVLGELRSVKSMLNGYQLRVKPGVEGDETPEEIRAREICVDWLKGKPSEGMTWHDTTWNMECGVFYGRRYHELVWGNIDGLTVPTEVLDRPNRRFVYTPENELRLLTKAEPINGEEFEPYRIVATRHMPSQENPYGRAVLSACFWPYTFKHGGFKFFYQFCERYGLPFPIGKYPTGTPLPEQQKLLDALLELIEGGAGVIPSDDSVEIKETSHSGELVQESLIHLCNREMSKALTSQTLATEMRQVGSNAASQTHYGRQQDVGQSDRLMIEASFDVIFGYITRFNVGEKVSAPKAELFKRPEPSEDRAKQFELAAKLSDKVPLSQFHEEMGIRVAKDDEAVLVVKSTPSPLGVPSVEPKELSACPDCGNVHQFADDALESLEDATRLATDREIETGLLEPIAAMLSEYTKQGKSLQQFHDDLPKLIPNMDDQNVADVLSQAMMLSYAQGMKADA